MSIGKPRFALPGSVRRVLGLLRLRHDVGGLPSADPASLRVALDQATDRAARYLHGQIREDGTFRYRIDAVTGVEDLRRYNVLRHAGSVLALAQHARVTGLAAGDAQRLMASGRFLVDHCVRALSGQDNVLAVWSDPELTGGRRRRPVAKLGGTGLVLAALVELDMLREETADNALTTILSIDGLCALGRFLRFMQRPDGSFQSLFHDRKSAREEAWVSLYYPGEAALGLIMLHERDPCGDWLEPAVRALNHLALSREGQTPPADHWALIATERLFACPEEALLAGVQAPAAWRSKAGCTGVRDALLHHAQTVVETILLEQRHEASGNCLPGWFGPEPRIAPTATRIEGLLAASRLPLQPRLMARLPSAITLGQRFLLASQLQSGPAVGGFTRTNLRCVRKEDRRATEVRIDYVQHALAALSLDMCPGRRT